MDLTLQASIASNAANMDEDDIRNLKRALNRLGHYEPAKTIGITTIPDRELFTAIKDFQKEQELEPTGEIRPNDATLQKLNDSNENVKILIEYTWESVGDKKVRDSHRELDGDRRIAGESLDPGEDPGCRCWMTDVKIIRKKACEEEKNEVEELQKTVKDLSRRLNDQLLKLKKLFEENNQLLKNAREALGSQVVAYILTLPFNRLELLSELLRRYFANIISSEFLEAADHFMRQFWAGKQKVKNTRDQRDIVLAQLERAAQKLKEAKERLEKCEKSTT